MYALLLVSIAARAADNSASPAAAAPAPGDDTLSGLQWDMNQIHAPEARAITGGSPSVLVGDIDTGLDYTHPDLAANVSDANSVNCLSGAPVQGMVAAMDDNGHGTHTAGTIAAAKNGIGIVGVAPNDVVRVAIDPPGTDTQSFVYENKYRNATFSYTDMFAPILFLRVFVFRPYK